MSPLKMAIKKARSKILRWLKDCQQTWASTWLPMLRDTLNPHDSKRYYEINFKSKNGEEQFQFIS